MSPHQPLRRQHTYLCVSHGPSLCFLLTNCAIPLREKGLPPGPLSVRSRVAALCLQHRAPHCRHRRVAGMGHQWGASVPSLVAGPLPYGAAGWAGGGPPCSSPAPRAPVPCDVALLRAGMLPRWLRWRVRLMGARAAMRERSPADSSGVNLWAGGSQRPPAYGRHCPWEVGGNANK